MPLPQKVIEQLGREPPKTPGWSSQLLMFASTVFFLSLFIYFGVAYGYKSFLNSQVQKLQDQINAFGEQVPADEQAKLIGFYSQLANLKSVLDKHVFSSKVFAWLEKNTQANVYYNKFDLNVSNGQLSLIGVAKTMDDVDQQLAIFQAQPEVSGADVSGVNLTGAIWQFGVILHFAPDFFRNSPAAAPVSPPSPVPAAASSSSAPAASSTQR